MKQKGTGVTIGVPIYRGERFLEETLRAIQRQTFRDFEVILSLDTPNAACEEICQNFLSDDRFRLVVHHERRGWVGQINWLFQQLDCEFWYYNQQDDIVDDRYLELLVSHARRNPSAALVYCDILPIGRISSEVFSIPSVLGATPYSRVMTMLGEHFPAFAFRGLTRVSAIAQAGPIQENKVDNFGVDTSWLTGIAVCGELHRIPLVYYKKRYHDNNTESAWWQVQGDERLRYWAHHCVDMLGQAIKGGGSPQQARMIWHGAVARLTAPEAAGHFLQVAKIARDERDALIEAFLDLAESRHKNDLPILLDAEWPAIRAFTLNSYWTPRSEFVEIVSFGPENIMRGQSFYVQQGGESALWVKTRRYAPPSSAIEISGRVLETTIQGTLLTAKVPIEATACAGPLILRLVGPDGAPCSNSVELLVHEERPEFVAIVSFGPDNIMRGQPFNVQPGGKSALWVKIRGNASPFIAIEISGRVLETTIQGTVLTAKVPDEVTGHAGRLTLRLVGPDGIPCSNSVELSVHEKSPAATGQ